MQDKVQKESRYSESKYSVNLDDPSNLKSNDQSYVLPAEKRKFQIFVKKPAKAQYGKPPNERTIDELLFFGVVVIDKPSGPTSHQVSSYVRDMLGLKKTGHSGTLDPKVTGVLPVALEKATRLNEFLLLAGKEYVALMHLHDNVDPSIVRKKLLEKQGVIEQLPPLRSAVKRRPRKRKVYYIEILDILGRDVLFRIGTEAGTYIRKFCHDFGKELGVNAHMQELRRTKVGLFNESMAISLTDFRDLYLLYKETKHPAVEKELRNYLLPGEVIVQHLPKVWVFDSVIPRLLHGSPLAIPGISKLTNFEKDEYVAVMTLKNELIAIGRALLSSQEILENSRGWAIKTDKVLLNWKEILSRT